MIARAAAVLLGLLLLPQPAAAWGAAGHAIVAEIAQRRLSPAARQDVEALLGSGVSLASIANWADTVQAVRHETRPWHYVNIPLDAEAYDAARDCPARACIVEALRRQQAILCDRSVSKAVRAEALRFIVHLIADIHQPLHAAERNDDLGGSRLPVTLLGEPTNLHAVWDHGLLDSRGFDWGEHVHRIEDGGLAEIAAEPMGGSAFEEWANEAHHLAATSAYEGLGESSLGADYVVTRSKIVDRQLGRAGARLARLLNTCLQ